MISALLLSPYAFAAISVPATPADVVGPFEPWPPYQNPYTSDNFTRNTPATTSGTSTGADITRNGTSTITTQSGTKVKIPVSVTSKVSKAAIAKAVARAAKFSPGGFAAGIVAEALIDEGIKRCAAGTLGDWCKEENVEPDVPADFSWRTSVGDTTKRYTTPEAACQSVAGNYANNVFLRVELRERTETYTDMWCVSLQNGTERKYNTALGQPQCQTGYTYKLMINGDGYCTPNNPTKKEVPATEPDIEDAAKKDQDKTPSNSPRMADGARKDGYSPDKPEFGTSPTTWNAPPVTTAPRETGRSTTTNADGTKSTTVTSEKTTVTPKTEGSTNQDTRITNYHVTNVTTTTITNNTTNQQTIIEDVQNGPDEPNSPDERDEEDLTFNDPSMPDVPKLYTQKYPDGIAGAWRDNKPDIQSTQFWAGIRSMFPEIGGGGSCPNFQLSFGIGNLANFGTMPFDVPCWIYQAIGLIMLTTAAFCARKIIF
ncbi:hypothetical protein ACFQUU_27045 [Herbaspirillum sp. GCM10030257]|uniref:hypothetical protein n=1 Tax=Herbaspirillum sp. GCM10030257 TaxID=3273393 RepID=UPI003617C117